MAGLLRLMFEFFKTGLFAVGGGLATLPFLYAIGESTGWYTAQDVANMIAISESTPGPMGVNMATYVGFNTFGIIGGILASLSLVFPWDFVSCICIPAAAKSLQSCPTLCDPIDGLLPGSSVPGILQAGTLEWVAFFTISRASSTVGMSMELAA